MTNGVIEPGSLIQLPIFRAYVDNDRRIGDKDRSGFSWTIDY